MMDRDRELHEMVDEGRALMSDYIKREDAINELASYYVPPTGTVETISKAKQDAYEIAYKIMRTVQSADVAPVRHGMWSKAKDNQGYTIEEEEYDFFYVCSACGRWTIGARAYCPNCGAKMDEGEDNE